MKLTKILAVNDEKFFLSLLDLCIGDKGAPIQLDQAVDGEEVIEKINKGTQYDAILMNLEMPIKNGWQTTEEIRDLGITTPIIAWSAHEKQYVFERCKDVGMDDYVEIDGRTLVDDILEALQRVGVKV